MATLTDAELTQARADLAATLPDTCVILRPTAGTSDGAGGYIGGTVSAAGTVACRIAPSGLPGSGMATEPSVAGQQGQVTLWTISLPALTDVRSTDRIQSGSVTYEITGVAGPRSNELARRVFAKAVE